MRYRALSALRALSARRAWSLKTHLGCHACSNAPRERSRQRAKRRQRAQRRQGGRRRQRAIAQYNLPLLSLEPELNTLRAEGAVDDATAARLIAVERRDVVSIYPELRLLTWAGGMLISWGVGLSI